MKKNFRNTIMLMAMAALTFGITACHNDNEDDISTIDPKAAAVTEQFVDGTVVPTYKSLASNARQLVKQLEELKANPTQAKLTTVCETFLAAREQWEKSEAFLFGPASNFGIDPHIDSWPLDADRFNALMGNANQLDELDGDDGDIVANGLESTLLGFHGLEYVLFKDGSAKNVSDITENELIYAVAVAGDLRNCCYRLAISWAGEDNVPAEYADKMEEAEWEYTVIGGDYSYGDNMKNAGKAGSTFVTSKSTLLCIIQGCMDITDEVGTQKIGRPFEGTSDEDIHYIESPYSQKSVEDFYNNIISIQNSYMGGIEGNRDEAHSLHTYLKEINSAVDSEVLEAINNALTAIDNMPRPFVDNRDDERNGVAMRACAELSEVLESAAEAIRKN